jgi:hypothetical protein
MQTIKQDMIERDAKLYEKLSVQVNKQISVLKSQKADAEQKKNNGSTEAIRQTWLGMYTAYSNALSELELANDRAHY